MQVRKYNHLLVRVEYPAERGYRMEPKQLPDWIHVTITEDKGSKYLTVHSRIHVNKEVRVGPSYSAYFNDRDLLKDLSAQVSSMFL